MFPTNLCHVTIYCGFDYEIDENRDKNIRPREHTRRHNERNNYRRFSALSRNASTCKSSKGSVSSVQWPFNEFPLQRAVGRTVWFVLLEMVGKREQRKREREREKKRKNLRKVTFDRWSVKMASVDFVESHAVTRVLCIRRYLAR